MLKKIFARLVYAFFLCGFFTSALAMAPHVDTEDNPDVVIRRLHASLQKVQQKTTSVIHAHGKTDSLVVLGPIGSGKSTLIIAWLPGD